MNLISELKKRNINARAYKRPPAGPDVFAITVDRRKTEGPEGVVLVNQGTAKVETVGSKKLRQVAATIREKTRKVSRRVRIGMYSDIEPKLENLAKDFRNNFPITMPSGTKWKEDRFKVRRYERGSRPYWHCWARVTAMVPNRTVNHLLIGMDETANFISPLPNKVKSIRNAHRALRPKNVPCGALRQGEWFFVPASKRMVKYLTSKAEQATKRRLGDTTHYALTSITTTEQGKIYVFARGYIWDMRIGHHEPLFLKDWHKCVHNKEAKLKVSADQREAAIRRRNRAWD